MKEQTDLDDVDAECSEIRLFVWVIVEVLKFSLLCEVEDAGAAFSDGGKSAQVGSDLLWWCTSCQIHGQRQNDGCGHVTVYQVITSLHVFFEVLEIFVIYF